MENQNLKPIEWNEYFLEIARTVAKRSNCIRAQVGAVIVGADKKIKATGYNGVPSKVISCMELGFCYRMKNNIPSGTRYETCRSIHAEQNAIIQAAKLGVSIEGATLYCTHQPCSICAKMIINSGISTVVVRTSPTEYRIIKVADWITDDDSPDLLLSCNVGDLLCRAAHAAGRDLTDARGERARKIGQSEPRAGISVINSEVSHIKLLSGEIKCGIICPRRCSAFLHYSTDRYRVRP